MKKILTLCLTVFLLGAVTETYAQTFGIKGGLNLANQFAKDDDDTYNDDNKMKLGFNIGVTLDIPISDVVSFETGLIASSKGVKVEGEGYESTGSLLYADIPLTAKFSFEMNRDSKFYIAAGPYVGFGLSGKNKFKVDGEDEDEADVEWGSDVEKHDLKRLDFGAQVNLGVELSGLQIGAGYGLGLANISPNDEDGFKLTNRVISVTVGYRFGGN
jgi:hypothetical protein